MKVEVYSVFKKSISFILLMEAENIFQCARGVWGHGVYAADIFFGKIQINHRSKGVVEFVIESPRIDKHQWLVGKFQLPQRKNF